MGDYAKISNVLHLAINKSAKIAKTKGFIISNSQPNIGLGLLGKDLMILWFWHKLFFEFTGNYIADYLEIIPCLFLSKQVIYSAIGAPQLDGKVVWKEKSHFASGEQNQRINLEQVVPGAYLITLLGDTFKSSRLLIKN